ncbi:MAG TPA: hypothetical protein VD978_07125 [Azospirillum sp.]|nr:hypothetical protein [Azospirillum sp.]
MAKSFKVPKKIAGVKIPKHLRKSVAGLITSPLGREVAAAALTAMAGVLASSNRQVREAAGEAGRTAAHVGTGAADLVRDIAAAGVNAALDAARELMASQTPGEDNPKMNKRTPDTHSKTH